MPPTAHQASASNDRSLPLEGPTPAVSDTAPHRQAQASSAPWGGRSIAVWFARARATKVSRGRVLGFGVIAAWAFGALLFLRADGSVHWPMPRSATPPVGEHNLAFFRYGPTLRASSYHRDGRSQHHPIFLLDARAEPHAVEKWTSNTRDEKPWIEIGWGEARRLSRVVIYHAGWREREKWTQHRYRLSCLVEGGARATTLAVRDNRESVATHPLPCDGARGVRINFTPNTRHGQVRIYEVEVWGQ